MQKLLLLADEAIALGAIDGGLSGVYAYPGTPSTEITEFIQLNSDAKARGIHSRWSANEKTAMESAIGMSFAGKRAMVCMKHVGLNVAADPFMNSAITGVNGGVLVLSADDPSMHSSQNEQDSRNYAKFALIPILEPSNQQEAYDMAYYGFEMSEKLGRPILLRITTRLAHSRSGVVRKEMKPQNTTSFPSDPKKFVLLPAIARRNYAELLSSQASFVESSENSPFNTYYDGDNKKRGIIACGVTYNYLMENKELINGSPILKIGQYPLPKKQIEKIMNECESILVIEEGYPIVEEMLKGFLGKNLTINGKLDGTLPRQGELNPDSVKAALSGKKAEPVVIPEIVRMRPPALCQGCGHRDMYEALNAVIKQYPDAKVFGDIGCYTLGALPPYGAINSCLDMGASITMAKGAADAGVFPAVAVIGDSTFTHSGITGLLDAVNENTNITVVISDNLTTAMTGGQDSAGTGKLEDICAGIGVKKEHIRVLVPLKKNYDEMISVIKEEIDYKGVSVIIPRRECLQTLKRKKK
ncbi:MAG: thiamine pyrophosphate-dependent enzyme [Paludibacteraceae bacterium]|nr:thiamine pyrophosphate-dependent enzyme [Paludibacteraceae bacterium]